MAGDLQIIGSGLNKAVSSTSRQLTSIDTVFVTGARIRLRF
jgi:hypothetical protein